jgi:putative methyltransferase (TIGR04325 family)
MNLSFKKIIKNLLPNFSKKISNNFQYNSFKSRYKNFEEANNLTTGYNSKKIKKKIEKAFKDSQKNSLLIDRDAQIISKKNNNFRLINHINNMIPSGEKSYAIDFGGSLGNFHRINKNYLKNNLIWIIFDKKEVIDIGKKYLKGEKFHFFSSIDLMTKFIKSRDIYINFFLFGSVLQYIDKIEKILKLVKSLNCKNIVIDRQPMLKIEKTSYSIQKVPFWNGASSFAVKLYNRRNFITVLNKFDFYLIDSFKGFGDDFKNGGYYCKIFKKR